MTVLPPVLTRPKMIVRYQMFMDYVDVKIVWHTTLFGKRFYINNIDEHLNSDNHFGIEKLQGVGQPSWDGMITGSM